MMICKADFEELFPELFRPSDIVKSVAEPSARCLARWEDDGGRTTSANIIPAATPPADPGSSTCPILRDAPSVTP